MIILNRNCLVLCYFLIFTIRSAYTASCDYVQSLSVSYRDSESSDLKQITVNGCIDETVFDKKEVKEIQIDCKTSDLSKIGPDFIKNLQHLEKLWISACSFETIDPGAFTNLPSLKEVIITKNQLQEVRSGVFNVIPSLTGIYLRINKISYVEDNAFADLPNLRVINLDHNRIEYIRREWFTNSTNIATFFMASNALRQIPPRMFEGWSKLDYFNFNSNEITQIHNGAFKDVAPFILNMDLHHNRLTTLSPKSFSDTVSFDVLRLSANLLNYLPEDFIKKVKVRWLYTHGNPFKCSCLERLHWVLHEKGDVIVDYSDDIYFYKPCYSARAPVCVVPSSSGHFCKEAVDTEATLKFLRALKQIGYEQKTSYVEEYKCARVDILTF